MSLKELVFNGGGARGTGMPGVYYAFKEARNEDKIPLWDGIEILTGTSVGSITAAFFCISPENSDIKELINEDILHLFDIDKVWLPYHLSLKKLENFINEYLKKHIKLYLIQHLKPSTQLIELSFRIKQPNYKITFYDLKLLNRDNPKKFKNILITSTTSEEGHANLKLYDAQRTPNFSIAEACIASSALPFLFQPVKINNTIHLDGGCTEPLPSEYTQTKPSERLLFVFGPGPSLLGKMWERTLFGPPNSELIESDSLEILNKQQELKINQIYYWIDEKNQQIFYRTHKTNEIHQIGFKELEIPKHMDKQDFSNYLVDFHTKLVLRGHSNSILGNYSPIWIFKYFSKLWVFLIGIHFNPANLFESLCQRIKTFYSFNTIQLHTPLLGNSFKQAEKVKRISIANFYLDTMYHLTLYNYTHSDQEDFYVTILENYLALYQTYLAATGTSKDNFLLKYQKETNKRVLFELIKEDASYHLNTPRAKTLTLAVELYLNKINQQQALTEINQLAKENHPSYRLFGSSFKKQNDLLFKSNKMQFDFIAP